MTVANQEQVQEQKQSQEQEPAQASNEACEGRNVRLFVLGRLVATPKALDFLDGFEGALPLIRRHVRGDFGDMCAGDIESNRRAIQCGGRVFSSYKTNDGKVWVITEADRSVTTVLLPSDY